MRASSCDVCVAGHASRGQVHVMFVSQGMPHEGKFMLCLCRRACLMRASSCYVCVAGHASRGQVHVMFVSQGMPHEGKFM